MATISKGFTFVTGQQITAARLNNLVDLATIAGIVRADFTTSQASPVTISDVAPSSPNEGEAWFDTSPGASEGKLRYYDGAQWVPVAEGFIGYNTSGGTISAGSLVKDASSAGGTGNLRRELAATASRHDIPAGMALADMTNGAVGVVITKGRVLSLTKATGVAVTHGDPVVPSTTAGAATSGADANFGSFFGSGVCGVWTKDLASGAASGEAYLFPAARASGVSYRTPTQLLTAAVPAMDNAWSGSFATPQWITWSVTPPGVIARLIQFRVRDVSATADVALCFGVRQAGSSLNIGTGAAHVAGTLTSDAGSAANHLALADDLIVPTNPAGDGTDRAEYLVKAESVIANIRVDLWETAVLCGGRIP